jgi:ATP-binding cassette, subfamily C, bacterial
MADLDRRKGRAELRASLRESFGLYLIVFLFSFFVNLLMLTGPLYMLQVYDRVLGSRSEETLTALSILLLLLFLSMGLLDHARARIMASIGTTLQNKLDRRVFQASVRRLTRQPDDLNAQAAQRDLEAVQTWLSSPTLIALFDIPWTPIFVIAIFIFHPMLGWLAVLGGLCLIAIALLNQSLSKEPLRRANAARAQAELIGDSLKSESESVVALGMQGAGFGRWQIARSLGLAETLKASDKGGAFAVTSRTFRMFLQSAMLGLGAWLTLRGELSPGAMIAGSILLGRALVPVDALINQWSVVQRAQEGWQRLSQLLTEQPQDEIRTDLPRPKAKVDVHQLTVIPPGEAEPVLHMISFEVEPGQAVGVIGPSGSGKSSLARALIGVWHPAGGKIRLDGATLDQFGPDTLGSYIGYLPQRVALFEGTIAENIARLCANADSTRIVEAARKAAAHDMILKLPDGYDTRVSKLGGRLSGGQIQRIGLARALYGDPVFLVLDEPNSNLDNDGSVALNQAIRAMKAAGGAVMIMAHRPAAIQECDRLLVLEDGKRRAFGPRDEVLRALVKNHTEIARAVGQGGAA